jgi:WhiB family transcriptional regulator, redox-sensing transcriptional regulator
MRREYTDAVPSFTRAHARAEAELPRNLWRSRCVERTLRAHSIRQGGTDVSDIEWQLRAACRPEPIERFYANDPEDVRSALEICRGCPVRVECLEAAVARGEWFGVWGGTTERERRRLIRARLADRAA